MLLSRLLENTGVKSYRNININKICINSKEVKKGDLFIAIKGSNYDGHDYITDAINNGADAILINNDNNIKYNSNVIKCNNTRDILGIICSNYYNNPSKEFTLIGITGTKGKTTTSFMIKKILEESGFKVGLIGTLGSFVGDNKIYNNVRTTPDSLELQYIFRMMADLKCDYVVIEVSSQSLKLNRVIGSNFDIGVFTNFSEDHISEKEHKNMKDYFLSKTKLFDMTKIAIVNKDDKKTKDLMNLKRNNRYIEYGINDVSNIELDKDKTSYSVYINKVKEKVIIFMPGLFNIYNSLCAIKVCELLNISNEDIIKGLKKVKVKGRNEFICNKYNLNIIIDYAHQESSMENILKTTNEYKTGKLITVFGCGGDRDKSKRKKMGELSGKLSDFTIITSDNPRNESPRAIIKEIEEGIIPVTNNYLVIEDRIKAIKKAISLASKEDIILLLGKGHEDYQEINNKKYPFDERIIIKKIMDNEI